MTAKLRIGAVAYLNTRPLVFGMEQGLGAGRIELSYAVPSALAEQMAAGALDVALLPIIEYARIPDLELVPGLGIVTHGPSHSVLLVSKRPAEQVETVALDPESCTSNALTQVLMADVWKRSPDYVTGRADLARTLADCDAAVRIGDKALFETPPDGAHVYDLGQVWSERTGLPFLFAAWVARRGLVDRELYRVLHESRREGAKVIDRIAEDYTWDGRQYPELARRYLTDHIRFRLGAAEIRAIELFFERAAAVDLIDAVPEIHLALERHSACHEAAQGWANPR